jgi:rare lipoprotein A
MKTAGRFPRAALAAAALLGLALGVSCVRRPPETSATVMTGTASWYGPDFHGRRTSNREIFNMYDLTAAHKSLPFGTRLMVTNLRNGKSVQVRVNDRGPFVGDRIIDLSYAAARLLEMVGPGTAPVRIEVLGPAPVTATASRFWVQVGAFSLKRNAELQLRRVVERYGFPEAVLSVFRTESQVFYRVRIPAGSRAEAESAARSLAASGLPVIIIEE